MTQLYQKIRRQCDHSDDSSRWRFPSKPHRHIALTQKSLIVRIENSEVPERVFALALASTANPPTNAARLAYFHVLRVAHNRKQRRACVFSPFPGGNRMMLSVELAC